MKSYATVAYARLKTDFDHEQFTYEFDRHILTRSQPQYNEARERDITADINQAWNMVHNDLYLRCDGSTHTSWQTKQSDSVQINGQPTWRQFALTEIDPADIRDPVLASANQRGAVAARNGGRHLNWRWKAVIEKKNLRIVDFIQNHLGLEKILFVAGVSLEPGRFATIHRDSMTLTAAANESVLQNRLFREGLVVININITNGGVPLYWSLDGPEVTKPKFVDDAVYMTSDYFLHGVPVVQSRRRQLRVTGVPGKNFDTLVDYNNCVLIPYDYVYDCSAETLSI